MPNRKAMQKRANTKRQKLWREYAIISIKASETKFFATSQIELPKDRSWRCKTARFEAVASDVKGVIVQVDIYNKEGHTIATSGPRVVGTSTKRIYVRNTDKVFTGVGSASFNLIAVKSICPDATTKTTAIGTLMLQLEYKDEVLPTACPKYLMTLEEQACGTSANWESGDTVQHEERKPCKSSVMNTTGEEEDIVIVSNNIDKIHLDANSR